jgi:hypothetical protein
VDGVVVAGQETVAYGQGYAPGASVELWLHSTPVHLATVTAGADGAFRTTIRIPSGTVPGSHQVASIGKASTGSQLELRTPVTVLAITMPPTDTAGGSGGSGGTPLLTLSLALLLAVVGLACLSATRADWRRRRH